MTSIEQLLGEFAEAWNAGKRPDVDAYLERAAPADRDELAAQLSTWLELAPTPSFDDETRAEIAAEPALVQAFAAAAELRMPVARRVASLRERAGLATADVAARLAARFSLEDEPRTAAYLERLEADELDERRLSQRLLDGLASILGADAGQLAPAPAGAAHGHALFRADEGSDAWLAKDIDALSRAALTPAPAGEMDELDRLFLGGPDG